MGHRPSEWTATAPLVRVRVLPVGPRDGSSDTVNHTPSGTTANSRTDFIRERVRADLAAGRFDGRVQTRFPPEPNGYLHIGHAKAICLNFAIAAEFDGICKLRFDDTNPETEEATFVEVIQDDIRWLGFEPAEVVFASDYFDQLADWAIDLIEAGLAYVDDQDAEAMSLNRGSFTQPGTDSPWRNRSVEENIDLFARMRDGEFAEGSRALRARIDMGHENMQMRDPVLYRIRHAHHYRTGDSWHVYPTYDWAHGQSDAIEGVTHSLCSLEFDSHRRLYDWCLEHLDLPGDKPEQTEFARLNLTHTMTSKRVLRTLVDGGLVDGWDDPRMPTLRGLKRRGYPPEAIRAFCSHIGVARVNGTHEIELLESFVRTHHNRHALRRMAVLKPLEVVIENWPEGQVVELDAINNPEDDSAGTRKVPFTGRLFIERDDFMIDPPKKFFRLAPGREVRLRAGFYITCIDHVTDETGEVVQLRCTYDPETRGGQAPDGRKVKATLHWVAAEHAVDADVILYGRLFTDSHPGADGTDPLDAVNPDSRQVLTGCKLEPMLADTPGGVVVQFERLGYFAHDLDDPGLWHRTVGLRDEWANIRKRRVKG